LLRYAVNPGGGAEELSGLLERFKSIADLEAAAACTMIALAAIFEESNDFSKFAPWLDEADLLITSGQLSDLAQAALLLQSCWADVVWQSDLLKITEALSEVLRLAELAYSPTTILMCSALGVYVYGWQGNLAAAEVLLHDAKPFITTDFTSPFAVQQYYNAEGLLLTLKGDTKSAESIFARLVREDLLNYVPNSAWLLVHANYLHCLVSSENTEGVDSLVGVMLGKSAPEQCWYYQSYLHFNLSIAELNAGRPYKALLHAEQGIKRGRQCSSVNAVRMSSLLKGQSLVDLQRNDEALEYFAEWIPRWEQARFYLIAAQACFEVAMIHYRNGEHEEARNFLGVAASYTPLNEMVPVVYRHSGYLEQLKKAVDELRFEQCHKHTPIFIQCFGDFAILVNGKRVDLSAWSGNRAVELLKAIISLGCEDISVDQIADTLWPEADGDKALGVFKVTLSRLRGFLREIYPESDLIYVKKGKVSLNLSKCTLDWKIFEGRANKAIKELVVDEANISNVMSMYAGDYLSDEVEAQWHHVLRDKLKKQYVQLGLLLAGSLRKMGRRDEEADCLERVLDYDVVNEQLYLQIMESYLSHGNPAKALDIYAKAEERFEQAYGVGPGDRLVQLANKLKEGDFS
jgi:DNA-binding SARP family transcriptional activator